METQKHKDLTRELSEKFRYYGYRVGAIDDITGNSPEIVKNGNRVGDGENKTPDIDAVNNKTGRIVRGEAKVGDGDIESEHSITQYLLFSNREKNGLSSWLYVIIPKNKKEFLNSVIIENVPRGQWSNIGLLESERYSD